MSGRWYISPTLIHRETCTCVSRYWQHSEGILSADNPGERTAWLGLFAWLRVVFIFFFRRCNRSSRGLEYAERRAPEPGRKPRGHEKRATDRAVPDKEQDGDRHWHNYSKSSARCSSREQQRSKHHSNRSHSVNIHHHSVSLRRALIQVKAFLSYALYCKERSL